MGFVKSICHGSTFPFRKAAWGAVPTASLPIHFSVYLWNAPTSNDQPCCPIQFLIWYAWPKLRIATMWAKAASNHFMWSGSPACWARADFTKKCCEHMESRAKCPAIQTCLNLSLAPGIHKSPIDPSMRPRVIPYWGHAFQNTVGDTGQFKSSGGDSKYFPWNVELSWALRIKSASSSTSHNKCTSFKMLFQKLSRKSQSQKDQSGGKHPCKDRQA